MSKKSLGILVAASLLAAPSAKAETWCLSLSGNTGGSGSPFLTSYIPARS
jgi:hypothetical protein